MRLLLFPLHHRGGYGGWGLFRQGVVLLGWAGRAVAAGLEDGEAGGVAHGAHLMDMVQAGAGEGPAGWTVLELVPLVRAKASLEIGVVAGGGEQPAGLAGE